MPSSTAIALLIGPREAQPGVSEKRREVSGLYDFVGECATKNITWSITSRQSQDFSLL